MLDELMDRFGEPPRSVQDLLRVAQIKARAHACYFTDLTQKGDEIHFTLYQKAKVDPDRIPAFMKSYRGRMKFVVGKQSYFSYTLPVKNGKREEVLDACGRLLGRMEKELFRIDN